MGETDNDIDPRDNGYGTNGVRQTEINEVSERLHGADKNLNKVQLLDVIKLDCFGISRNFYLKYIQQI